VYLKSQIKYARRVVLEGSNSNATIIDIIDKETHRIINVYWSYKPPNGISQREMFRHQLQIIRAAYINRAILLCNFNLDLNRFEDPSYVLSNYFEEMNTILGDVVLEQLITFPTWSRCVNGVTRESLLDHIYCS
jgi:hypothetical protein